MRANAVRAAFTLVVALIALALLFVRAADSQQTSCIENEMVLEQVRSVMLAGIDQALKEHAVKMFNVWMKDPTNQPKRAISGMRSAIIAYNGSRAAAQRWNPPLCAVR